MLFYKFDETLESYRTNKISHSNYNPNSGREYHKANNIDKYNRKYLI